MSWYWKKDLRFKDEEDSSWERYEAADEAKIEKAFKKGQKTLKLSDKYKIDFQLMVQHRIEDKDRQRPIRRKDAPAPAAVPAAAAPVVVSAPAVVDKLSLRPGGKTRYFQLNDYAKYTKACLQDQAKPGPGAGDKRAHEEEEWDEDFPKKVPFDKIKGCLPAATVQEVQYGDVLNFHDYRGVGMYIVGKEDNKLVLLHTLGEFGGVLPKAIRSAIPKSYWADELVIQEGFTEMEGMGLDDDADDSVFE